MKALLDTHVALWWYENPELLNHASRAIIEDTGNAVFISSASVWELNLKVTLGKVKIPTGFVLKAMEDFLELPIRATHAEQLLKIDMLHRDPFDLMLIAQAIEEDLILLTRDKMILQYPIKCIEV